MKNPIHLQQKKTSQKNNGSHIFGTIFGPKKLRHHLTVRHEVPSPQQNDYGQNQLSPTLPLCESQIILTFQIPLFNKKKRHTKQTLERKTYTNKSKNQTNPSIETKSTVSGKSKNFSPRPLSIEKKKQASVPESDPTTCRAGPKNGPMDRPRNKVTRGFIFRWKNIYKSSRLPTSNHPDFSRGWCLRIGWSQLGDLTDVTLIAVAEII